MTWHRGLAWTAAGITGVVLCTAVWLMAQDPSPAHLLILAAAVILGVVPAAAGVFVAQDRGTGVLGVLLVLPGLNAALLFTEVLAQDVAAPPPGADYVTAASQGTWILLYVVVALPLLFFPEGRLGSRLGRWLFSVILLDAAVFMVTAATAPGPFLPPDESTPHVLGTIPAPLAAILTAVTLPLLPVSLILVVVDLTRRYRASEPGRRRQYRWLIAGSHPAPGDDHGCLGQLRPAGQRRCRRGDRSGHHVPRPAHPDRRRCSDDPTSSTPTGPWWPR